MSLLLIKTYNTNPNYLVEYQYTGYLSANGLKLGILKLTVIVGHVASSATS